MANDFLSWETPFWNYWNGDYASLGDEYKRCECGRIYRDFSIRRSREALVGSKGSYEISKKASSRNGISRISKIGDKVRVFVEGEAGDKKKIEGLLGLNCEIIEYD